MSKGLKKLKQQFIDNYKRLKLDYLPEGTVEDVMAPLFEHCAKELQLTKCFFWLDPVTMEFIPHEIVDGSGNSEITALFAFASEQDAKRHPSYSPGYAVGGMDIFNLLLQFFTLKQANTWVFYNVKGKLNNPMVFDKEKVHSEFRRLYRLSGLPLKAPLAGKGHFGLA